MQPILSLRAYLNTLHTQPEIQARLTRLLRYFSTLFALGICGVLIWAGSLVLQQPESGISVNVINGRGALSGFLSPKEITIRLSDPATQVQPALRYQTEALADRRAEIRLALPGVQKQAQSSMEVSLSKPGLAWIATRLTPIGVAFVFWLLGLFVLLFGVSDRLSQAFFWFTLTYTLILGLGSVAPFGSPWTERAFSWLLWWIGPLTLLVHAHLTQSRRLLHHMPHLFFVSLVISSLDLLRLLRFGPELWASFRFAWLLGTLGLAAVVLLVSRKEDLSVESRRNARIASLSAGLAFLPFLLFSLVPQVLINHKIFPSEVIVLALPALPLGYTYAILRSKLIRFERYVSRSAAYALVLLLIMVIYSLVYLSVRRVSSGDGFPVSPLELAILLLLILAVQPVYRFLQHWVDAVFYGGWYQDRAATRQISKALSQGEGSTGAIAETLCQALQRTMQLEYARLWLVDGRLVISGDRTSRLREEAFLIRDEPVAKLLIRIEQRTGREMGSARELAGLLPISEQEQRSLFGSKPQNWLLLGGESSPQGLLILSTRRGGGELSPKDLEILEVVLRQAGAALENESLLKAVRQQAEINRALSRQVFQAREEERKRLARDLHDRSIQTLAGLNYQLADLRAEVDGESRQRLSRTMQTLQAVASDLRQVCTELRPAGLDSLGLAATIQARVAELQTQVPFDLNLSLDEKLEKIQISEAFSLCLYRFFQEGIRNIQKHASAEWALVSLEVEDDAILINVEDDGQGFDMPVEFGRLVAGQHFGLVGLREQVEVLGGQMCIRSAPGQGCSLSARLPLSRGVSAA